ncbi:MAG: nucleotidyltransferase domain-containing protein [Ignisphaera sp.]|nr:nucleotidyltransferase domain-containing protein [Ignisphaera sp.]
MKTIFKSIHGSHLYGANYAGSDTDYKVVFAHSLSELVTGADDCFRVIEPDDIENFSVKKFSMLLHQQQTNVIEMLFTPDQFIVETSPAWEELRANKALLVSKNIMPFVGYAKQQARVYSEKGNSLNMLKELNEDLKNWLRYHSHDASTQALEYTDGKYASNILPELFKEYPQLVNRGEKLSNIGTPIPYIQILNKQFECFVPVNEWALRIQNMIDTYGERAKSAAKEGAFDRKAMYHAVRIIDEASELLNTGSLVFPRPVTILPLLKAIRFDEAVSFSEAQDILMGSYDYLMNVALPSSQLQENIDKDFLNNWFKSTQSNYIKKELNVGG